MVGKININFQILEVADPFILFIADTSNWVYAEDKPAFVDIRLPASRKFNRYTWKKKHDNLFNSHNLGISCLKGDCTEESFIELPDGIYEIKLLTSYKDIYKTKIHLRTERFKIEYYKTLINLGEYKELSKKQLDSFNKIQYTLERAKAYTMEGKEREATQFFREAQEELASIKCNYC